MSDKRTKKEEKEASDEWKRSLTAMQVFWNVENLDLPLVIISSSSS